MLTKKWKQPKYSWIDKWISHMCYIHMMKYYLAKAFKVLIYVITWISLENEQRGIWALACLTLMSMLFILSHVTSLCNCCDFVLIIQKCLIMVMFTSESLWAFSMRAFLFCPFLESTPQIFASFLINALAGSSYINW